MTDKILPCPFCGSSDVHLRHHPPAQMSWVSCVGCGLEAPTETGVSDDAAVTYWNRRTPTPETIQPVCPIRSGSGQAALVRDDRAALSDGGRADAE